ncbi:MAG: signal recognition particle protein [Actinomycetota bacterium]
MFDNLSARFESVFKSLRRHGRLTEADVDAAMREIRLALLEADVNFKVVKDFVAAVRERSIGEEVRTSLTPAQQVVKIVNEELIGILGHAQSKLIFAPKPPTVVMVAGLQGSGKTTIAAKLAHHLKATGHHPLLAACDLQRPAAVQQLKILGEQAGVPVFAPEPGTGQGDPVVVAEAAVREVDRQGRDVVILDTAGRLHIDPEMMAQARAIKERTHPHEILLVVDSMTGQDAVNVAVAFAKEVDFSGIVLSKLDGDARGGAALSVASVSGKPVKFAGVGEKLADFEVFHPDRMASRILGMGDVLTLIEKAEATMDAAEAAKMQEKLIKASFTLEDFLSQLRQMKKMGPLSQILGMLPGVGKLKDLQVDDTEMARVEAIICSMTPHERRDPRIISGSRRARIARGSGTTTQEVNQLLRQFEGARKLLKTLGAGAKGRRGPLQLPF